MEQQELKELKETINKLMDKIESPKALFDEKEMVPIKAFWEHITGLKLTSMTSCGGMLCEDIRKSIINWKKQNPVEAVERTTPVKTVIPAELRETLYLQACTIAKLKKIKSPNKNTGVVKLQIFIKKHS